MCGPNVLNLVSAVNEIRIVFWTYMIREIEIDLF